MFAEALQTNNNATAKQLSESVSGYQERFAQYDLPTESKTKANCSTINLWYLKASLLYATST
jgi:hypothetical protein